MINFVGKINLTRMKTIEEITQASFALPPDIVSLLEANSVPTVFKKKDSLIAQGETSPSVYLIAEGICAVVYSHNDDAGTKDTLLFGTQGDIAMSPTNFMFHRPAIFSISAVTKVMAYKINPGVISSLYEGDSSFCRWLVQVAITQLSQLEIRHTYMAPKDAYKRFLNLMRFKPKSFLRSVPDYQIASYLGVSPTTLSLLKARWAKDNDRKATYDREFLESVGINNPGT